MWLANGVVAIHLTIEGNKKTTELSTLVVNSSEQRKQDHITGLLIAIHAMKSQSANAKCGTWNRLHAIKEMHCYATGYPAHSVTKPHALSDRS